MTEDPVSPPDPASGAERRIGQRQPARMVSRLRLNLDSAGARDGAISHVTVTDISQTGLATEDIEQLFPGALVMLDVPLLGWREAEVIWSDGQRAGCRFLHPLTLDELSGAVATSPRIREDFPGLARDFR